MRQKFAFSLMITLTLLLALFIFAPAFLQNSIQTVQASQTSTSWAKIESSTHNSTLYTSVGQNQTLSFSATYSSGEKAGQTIENATVTIQVKSLTRNQTETTLDFNTTSGTFLFNYSSTTADVLSFSAVSLVTQDSIEYIADSFGVEGNILQSDSVTVWYDTFHVSLIEYNTNIQGITNVVVNVTYFLLPEAGLNLSEWASVSNQAFLPKMVHQKNITINKIQAQETTTAGIYIANVSTWLPTSFVHVTVSDQNWTTTNTGFSFTHSSNIVIWGYVAGFAGVSLLVGLFFKFVKTRQSKKGEKSKGYFLPLIGGILLAIVSVQSLYWAVVGFNGVLIGFEWIILGMIGLLSCIIGFAGAVFAFKRKNQAFVIFATILPLITNLIVVKNEFDVYQLNLNWLIFIISFIIVALSGILLSNADEQFTSTIKQ